MWCNGAALQLNITKTKETVILFRKKMFPRCNRKVVDRVEEYKYLGTIFHTTLKFQQNIEAIITKAHLRIYVLRKSVLKTIYSTFTESVLSFSFLCWLPLVKYS